MVILFLILGVFLICMAILMSSLALADGGWKYFLVVIMFIVSAIGFLYAGCTYEWVGPMYKYVEMI